MLERKYSVISIFKDMWREKIITVITVIICIILGTAAGYMTFNKESAQAQELKDQLGSAPVEGEDEYITQLRDYEESLAACEEALALAEEQRDTHQKTIDNSIVMKIDPANVQTAYVSYAILDNGDAGSILSALQSYIYDGGLKEDAIKNGGADLEVEGWREVITADYAWNNLFITVSHYDADKVKAIMNVIKNCVEAQTDTISQNYGGYRISLIDESYYVKSDENIANKQNSYNDNLKWAMNSVSDQTYRLNDIRTNIDTFKEKNEIKEGGSVKRGLKKTLVIYAVIGMIGGVILSFAIIAVKAVLSDKIMCYEHLQYAGITVFNRYDVKTGKFASDEGETFSEISCRIRKNGSGNICVYALSKTEKNNKVVELLKDKLDVEVKTGSLTGDCENVVVILSSRSDRYSDLEALMQKCSRMGINFLGVIVNE